MSGVFFFIYFPYDFCYCSCFYCKKTTFKFNMVSLATVKSSPVLFLLSYGWFSEYLRKVQGRENRNEKSMKRKNKD